MTSVDTTAPDQKPFVSRGIQLACIRCAIPMVLLLMTGLVVAGFLPPLLPSDPADVIARIYGDNTGRIRVGIGLCMFSVLFFYPFGCAIAVRTRRIEGTFSVLTYTQIACIGSASMTFIVPFVCFMTAAYRPDRPQSELLLLNDVGWISFVFMFVAFLTWNVAIGIAILSDSSPEPVYPPWLGYLNFWVAASFVPDILVPFFHSGPFGWNGLISFWLAFALYLAWIIAIEIKTERAIKAESTPY